MSPIYEIYGNNDSLMEDEEVPGLFEYFNENKEEYQGHKSDFGLFRVIKGVKFTNIDSLGLSESEKKSLHESNLIQKILEKKEKNFERLRNIITQNNDGVGIGGGRRTRRTRRNKRKSLRKSRKIRRNRK